MTGSRLGQLLNSAGHPRARLFGATFVAAVLFTSGAAKADAQTACFDAAEQGQLLRYRADLLAAQKRFFVCASDSCPAAVRHDCARWLVEVEAAMPSVAIHARDARGHDVIDARVLVDGVLLAEKLSGSAVPLNPGAHTLRLEAAGAVFEDRILVTEGQKDRVVDATFANEVPRAGVPPPRETAVPDGERSSWLLPGIFAGIGVVALGLGAYFEVSGQNEYGDLKNGCARTSSCLQGDVDANKRKLYLLAPISLGVGVVSLGVAAGVLLLAGHRASAADSWRLGAAPLVGGGAWGAVGRDF
jgi:hypothetical protein